MNTNDYTAGRTAYRNGEGVDCLHGQTADFDRGYWDEHNAAADEVVLTHDDCLDAHKGDCDGPVEYRPAMSPTGKWFPRCEGHFSARLDRQEQIVSRYGGQMFY